MTREPLPDRRCSESWDMNCDGSHYSVQVSYYEDGRLGEVFVHSRKVGSQAEINARDAAILLSMVLQHGAEPDKIMDALTHDASGRPEGVIGQVLERVLATMPGIVS